MLRKLRARRRARLIATIREELAAYDRRVAEAQVVQSRVLRDAITSVTNGQIGRGRY